MSGIIALYIISIYLNSTQVHTPERWEEIQITESRKIANYHTKECKIRIYNPNATRKVDRMKILIGWNGNFKFPRLMSI